MKNGIIALFCTFAMATTLFCGCTAPPGDGTTVSGTGTVVYNDFEGGFYGIVASDGAQYYPLNLPGELQVNGLPVTFTGTIETGVATTVQWGTPLSLTSITGTGTPIPTEPGSVSMEQSLKIARLYEKSPQIEASVRKLETGEGLSNEETETVAREMMDYLKK